jgi:hypothetical protein
MIIWPAEENPLIVETDDGPAEFVFSGFQWRIGFAQAVRDAFREPIHPCRWFAMPDRFKQAINERAATHEVSKRQSITRVAQSAFKLALADSPAIRLTAYGEPVLRSAEEWCRTLRRNVERLATEDLLGDQRQPPRAQPASRLVGTERNVALELDYLMASGVLTEHEARIVRVLEDTVILRGGDFQEAADQLQMSYGALKRALQRIRAKTS